MAKLTKEDAKDIVAKLLASKVISREDIAFLFDQSPLNDVTEMYHTLICRQSHDPNNDGWCDYYTPDLNRHRDTQVMWANKVRTFIGPLEASYKDMLAALQEITGILSIIESSDNTTLIDLLLGDYYSSNKDR